MSRSCILHIGMHKTGSTALQHALKGYDDGDTHYAELRDRNHSAAMMLMVADRPEEYRQSRHQGWSAEHAAAVGAHYRGLFETAVSKGRRRMIISAESMSLPLSPTEIQRVVKLIYEHFDELKVVAYVRPFHSFIESYFQQSIKQGLASFTFPLPEYRARFGQWIEAVGEDNIVFYPMVKDCVAHFGGLFDLPLVAPAKRTKTNKSLSAEGVAFLYCLHKLSRFEPKSPEELKIHGVLESTAATLGSRRLILSEEIHQRLQAEAAKDIAWMQDRLDEDVIGKIPQPDAQSFVLSAEEQLLDLGSKWSPTASIVLAKYILDHSKDSSNTSG